MPSKSDVWRYSSLPPPSKKKKNYVKEHFKLKNMKIKKSDTLSQYTIQPSTSNGPGNKVRLIILCGCVSNLFCKY